MNIEQKHYTGLDYFEVLNRSQKSKAAVILCHGYGADATDLIPLHQECQTKSLIDWYFPNGIQDALGGFGRAWFSINIQELEKARVEGRPRIFTEKDIARIEPAAETVSRWIRNELEHRYDSIFVGGFSQGAMLACELTLRLPKVTSTLLLSGTFFDRNSWPTRAQKKGTHSFFQSHGRADAILPFSEAEALYNTLTTAGWRGEWHPFNGGHDIPGDIAQKMGKFIEKYV